MVIGAKACDFKTMAVFEDNTIKELVLSDYIKDCYCVLFFYPLDFTFVCPTEIVSFNNKIEDFKKRKVKIIGISVDSVYAHLAWKNMPNAKGGIGDVNFALASDLTRNISNTYNVLNDEGVANRGLFIIDNNFIVRYVLVSDASIGRNAVEVIRIIDALKHADENQVACPAGWNNGEDTIIHTSESVGDFLSKNKEKI